MKEGRIISGATNSTTHTWMWGFLLFFCFTPSTTTFHIIPVISSSPTTFLSQSKYSASLSPIPGQIYTTYILHFLYFFFLLLVIFLILIILQIVYDRNCNGYCWTYTTWWYLIIVIIYIKHLNYGTVKIYLRLWYIDFSKKKLWYINKEISSMCVWRQC